MQHIAASDSFNNLVIKTERTCGSHLPPAAARAPMVDASGSPICPLANLGQNTSLASVLASRK